MQKRSHSWYFYGSPMLLLSLCLLPRPPNLPTWVGDEEDFEAIAQGERAILLGVRRRLLHFSLGRERAGVRKWRKVVRVERALGSYRQKYYPIHSSLTLNTTVFPGYVNTAPSSSSTASAADATKDLPFFPPLLVSLKSPKANNKVLPAPTTT